MIGYLLEQSLLQCDPGLRIVTLVTQTVVAEDDPAFASPSKPIGPMYDGATAQQLAETRGFEVGRDGEGWRRVVPSPSLSGCSRPTLSADWSIEASSSSRAEEAECPSCSTPEAGPVASRPSSTRTSPPSSWRAR